MDRDKNKEPKISKLRELIEQLEAPKKAGLTGKAQKDIFRSDAYEDSSLKASYIPKPKKVLNAAEFMAAENKIKIVPKSTVEQQGYTELNSADGFVADTIMDADDVKVDKKYSKRGKKSKTQQKPEERFTNVNQVYDYALNLLTFRDYSKAEMFEKLIKKGAPENFSREAVAKLLEYNFLNEERYAFRVYEMWLNKRVYGRMHLQAELKKRSIDAECIAKVLEQFTVELEEQRAEAAVGVFMQQNRKKLQDLQKLETSSLANEEQEDIDFLETDEEETVVRSLRKSTKKTSKWGSRWGYSKTNKAAERMAALKKIQAAAGRFMAARGFSARFMHILLCRLYNDNDM